MAYLIRMLALIVVLNPNRAVFDRLFHRGAGDEAWEGIVVEKSRNMPDGSNMYHYLQVKTSDGETRKVRVKGNLWDSVAEGDALTKKAGEEPTRA